jgi:hypothetical protein
MDRFERSGALYKRAYEFERRITPFVRLARVNKACVMKPEYSLYTG